MKRICPMCGKEFEAYKNAVYCSRECGRRNNTLRARERQRRLAEEKKAKDLEKQNASGLFAETMKQANENTTTYGKMQEKRFAVANKIEFPKWVERRVH